MTDVNTKLPFNRVRLLVREFLISGNHLERNGESFRLKTTPIQGIKVGQEFRTEDAAVDAIMQNYFADDVKQAAA